MKNNYIFFLLLASFFFFWKTEELKSQDIHFSQYQQTSQLVNPALTGALSVLRATVIYKNQWGSVTSPYKTFGVSVENRFKSKPKKGAALPAKDEIPFRRFAAGLSFYSDKAGDGNMGTTQANLSFATFVPTSLNSSLSGGVQVSIIQRSVDLSKLRFTDQYNGTTYDPSISNGEISSSQSFVYPDIAAGVNWNYGFSESLKEEQAKLKANIGASVYHINTPKQEFLIGSKDKVDMKYVVHADFLIGLKQPNLALAPSIIYTLQGPVRELLLGAMIKYYFVEGPMYYGSKASSAIGFGISYRNKDAAIASLLLEYGHYGLGVSYDINNSNLNNVSRGKGGPEVFLRYVAPNQFGISHKPKRRYNLK
jgi:type IX secretion system PorP/SprF family membrane protein